MPLPNLNEVVLRALDFLASQEPKVLDLDLPEHKTSCNKESSSGFAKMLSLVRP